MIEYRCDRSWSYDGCRVYAFERKPDHTMAVFGLTVMQTVKEGDYVEPTWRLDRDQGQQLMDELWQVGFRPTEGTGSAGSLKATERHLEDMRRLVFRETDAK